MTERPIIFSAPMVRAILADPPLKTQTRRVLKPQPPECDPPIVSKPEWYEPAVTGKDGEERPGKPVWGIYGDEWGRKIAYQPGDILWVRETWQHAPVEYCRCPQPSEASPCDDWSNGTGCRSDRGSVVFRADGSKHTAGWRSPTHMPRWASRTTLRVTDVRVQRLQDISEEDARAEGVHWRDAKVPTFRDALHLAWDSIHTKHPEYQWDANPWVEADTFERVRP